MALRDDPRCPSRPDPDRRSGCRPAARPRASRPSACWPAPTTTRTRCSAPTRSRGGIALRALRPFARAVASSSTASAGELARRATGCSPACCRSTRSPRTRWWWRTRTGSRRWTTRTASCPRSARLDLHLIGEGRHEQLWKALGARADDPRGGDRHPVRGVGAERPRGAGRRGLQLLGRHRRSRCGRSASSGVWELFVPGVGEGARYKFEITSPGRRPVPARPTRWPARTEVPPATASVVTASHYEWGDEEWMARRGDVPVHEAPFSVYEVHLPSWRPGLTYRQLAEQLPAYVKDLGFTHVELMPVAEHPFGGSWGYQVTSFYAPTARLGTPDDFRFLVDALHRAGIGVIMDWVPAHFPRTTGRWPGSTGSRCTSRATRGGPSTRTGARWSSTSAAPRCATSWSPTPCTGARSSTSTGCGWTRSPRCSTSTTPASSGQWTPNVYGGREDLDAVAFLQEMNATVYRRAPGVVTIAEESTAWDGVTRPTDSFGGLGFGLKWNMGWMHDSLGYMSHEPVHRKYHHHEMTFSMVYAYSENYVLPISHDEVVHGKRRWCRRCRATGGSSAPTTAPTWASCGPTRASNSSSWARSSPRARSGPRPTARTGGCSTRRTAAEPDHRGVRDLVRDLNTVYRATPALWQRDTDPAGFRWVDGDAAEDNVFAFLRFDADGRPAARGLQLLPRGPPRLPARRSRLRPRLAGGPQHRRRAVRRRRSHPARPGQGRGRGPPADPAAARDGVAGTAARLRLRGGDRCSNGPRGAVGPYTSEQTSSPPRDRRKAASGAHCRSGRGTSPGRPGDR